jgi:hypothetical protein
MEGFEALSNNDLFHETGKDGHRVKMGTTDFLDFGKNM